MDMFPAYISAVSENLKEAVIVFDHFHVIKLFNEKLSDFRRKLYRDATTAQQKNVRLVSRICGYVQVLAVCQVYDIAQFQDI